MLLRVRKLLAPGVSRQLFAKTAEVCALSSNLRQLPLPNPRALTSSVPNAASSSLNFAVLCASRSRRGRARDTGGAPPLALSSPRGCRRLAILAGRCLQSPITLCCRRLRVPQRQTKLELPRDTRANSRVGKCALSLIPLREGARAGAALANGIGVPSWSMRNAALLPRANYSSQHASRQQLRRGSPTPQRGIRIMSDLSLFFLLI
ncbi:uncharacterized protein [Pithys albifrons albifrons]|uniref:uncharacterized protein n=1 Tax=Pithys albifrons albifrons TaxID=3385563 RepID=UPI003A5D0B47